MKNKVGETLSDLGYYQAVPGKIYDIGILSGTDRLVSLETTEAKLGKKYLHKCVHRCCR